jgi:outer membrane protein OmpA-like peptidoglycan-associated protein
MRRIVTLTLMTTLALAGCTTVNPYTRESQTSKATIGAASGAVGGALIGLLTGDNSKERRKQALIGAGVGALAGGGIGYYMDVQEAKLRQVLEGTGVGVTRSGQNIMLNMPGNITFDTASDAIQADFYEVLDSVALVLNKYPKTTVDVVGHTDSVGEAGYNQMLSEQRAGSVAKYLSGQKVLATRLLVQGRGENQPVASNNTEAGRKQNRRVEIVIVPLTI